MDAFSRVKDAWNNQMDRVKATPWMRRLEAGDMRVDHYKAFLRETYFNARENPQLQAFATVFFKGSQREVIKRFYQHAISEIGHDQLALDDLATLGVDVSKIPSERPLPATAGLIAFGFYQVEFTNVLGYLGYLFHLEFMPTQNGPRYMERLEKLGIPRKAMTFLEEHATVDIYHNKLMEGYLAELMKTESDVQEVIWAARTACVLHGNMMVGAFESVEAESLRMTG